MEGNECRINMDLPERCSPTTRCDQAGRQVHGMGMDPGRANSCNFV